MLTVSANDTRWLVNFCCPITTLFDFILISRGVHYIRVTKLPNKVHECEVRDIFLLTWNDFWEDQ
jgi:hypothetical protein